MQVGTGRAIFRESKTKGSGNGTLRFNPLVPFAPHLSAKIERAAYPKYPLWVIYTHSGASPETLHATTPFSTPSVAVGIDLHLIISLRSTLTPAIL